VLRSPQLPRARSMAPAFCGRYSGGELTGVEPIVRDSGGKAPFSPRHSSETLVSNHNNDTAQFAVSVGPRCAGFDGCWRLPRMAILLESICPRVFKLNPLQPKCVYASRLYTWRKPANPRAVSRCSASFPVNMQRIPFYINLGTRI